MRILTLLPFSQSEIEGTTETFLERVFEKKEIPTGGTIPCSKEELLDGPFEEDIRLLFK